jgi:mono/diheme cytochrome c family protein
LTLLLIGAFVIALCTAISAQYNGWSIPPTAKDEKSPLSSSADVLAKGKDLFTKNCQRCHGAQGKGDGPESDPKEPAADLSDEFRAPLNPDGVMFYRVLNGHPPTMPAFKDTLSKDEIWTVVEYAKSLRKPG